MHVLFDIFYILYWLLSNDLYFLQIEYKMPCNKCTRQELIYFKISGPVILILKNHIPITHTSHNVSFNCMEVRAVKQYDMSPKYKNYAALMFDFLILEDK